MALPWHEISRGGRTARFCLRQKTEFRNYGLDDITHTHEQRRFSPDRFHPFAEGPVGIEFGGRLVAGQAKILRAR